MTSGLRIANLTSGYGKMVVVDGINMEIPVGTVACVLGRNGVGKTTLLKTMMDLIPAMHGELTWKEINLRKRQTYEYQEAGIAYVPQDQALFSDLTVAQNLRLGCARKVRFEERWKELQDTFPVLSERLSQKAGTLSGGEQKMLLMARALLNRPDLLLIDEVSEGVQPSVVHTIGEVIKQINQAWNCTVLIVEQNLNFALDVTSQYFVLDHGTIIDAGTVDGNDTKQRVASYLAV